MNRVSTLVKQFRRTSHASPASASGGSSLVSVSQSSRGKRYLLELNRPKALNSLNVEMIEAMTQFYESLLAKDQETVVVLKGRGKAFCAGGDVRHLYDLRQAEASVEEITHFFKVEYRLDDLMASLPPNIHNVALLNGITMGGGVGISVHGRYRVASEETLFAMPETAIGFYTDVGGAHFLPRLVPKGLGMYLALTGHRLRGADCLHAGIATHFVALDRMGHLENALLEAETASSVPSILADFAVHSSQVPLFSLASDMSKIEKHFTQASVEAIVSSLREDDSDFAQNALRTLNTVSPTALKVIFEALQRGRKLSLREVLDMELKVVTQCMKEHDTFEGIRAVLVDKDKCPKWKPVSLADVSEDDIRKYFS